MTRQANALLVILVGCLLAHGALRKSAAGGRSTSNELNELPVAKRT